MRRLLSLTIAFLLVAAAIVLWNSPAYATGCDDARAASGENGPCVSVGGGSIRPSAQGTPTDGGTPNAITLGGFAQNAFNVNAKRHGCSIQNLSSSDLWINEMTTAAVGTSRWVPAGSEWSCPPTGVPTGAISITGPTTGQPIYKVEW